MIAPEPDLQLLSAVLVLLRPSGIVFFHDLAVLDDALDFGNEERADAHCSVLVSSPYVERFMELERGSTHFLCESESHCDSWSYWHIAPWHFVRRQSLGSRILGHGQLGVSGNVVGVDYPRIHGQICLSGRNCNVVSLPQPARAVLNISILVSHVKWLVCIRHVDEVV